MHCVITAGPTYEPLDEVRRLTNFSTGRLGSELANYLAQCGHEVTLLAGQQSTYRGSTNARHTLAFSTTANLREQLHSLSTQAVDAVFHAAAVSDFCFGKVWARSDDGNLEEVVSKKISTHQGRQLLAELRPTPKILGELRSWFPKARIVGWKYEVEGERADALRAAEEQIRNCSTDACVANGRAYGPGFGLLRRGGQLEHADTPAALYRQLEEMLH